MKLIVDVPNSLYANLKKIANGSIACKRLLECVKAGEPAGNTDKLEVKGDLISRSALKKALEVTQYNDIDDLTRTERLIDNALTVCNDNYSMGYQDGVKKVLSERPTGEWEYGYIADNNLDEIIRCSVCHRFDTAKYIDGRNPYCDYPAFCKRCGADMRGGRE